MCYECKRDPPPQRHPGLPPGADPGEHDGLSRLLGPGVSLRDALGLVPLLLGLRLAAEHLLHLYSPVRLLLADGPPSPPPGADELLRRGRGVAGDPGRDAGGADPVRRADFFRDCRPADRPSPSSVGPDSAPAGACPQLFPVSAGAGCESRLSRLCLGAAAAAAPWLVHKSRHRRSGFSRPRLCVLRLFRPAAVALSVLDRVLSLPAAAGDPRPAGHPPAGAVRYKPSLSAALSAASAGAVRCAGAAAHHFARRSFLCSIN